MLESDCLTQSRRAQKRKGNAKRCECDVATQALCRCSRSFASLRLAPLREIILATDRDRRLHRIRAATCIAEEPAAWPAGARSGEDCRVGSVCEVSSAGSAAVDADAALRDVRHAAPHAARRRRSPTSWACGRSSAATCARSATTRSRIRTGEMRVVAGVSCESCHGGGGRLARDARRLRRRGRHEGDGVGRASREAGRGKHRPGHEQSAQHLSHRPAVLRLPHGAERALVNVGGHLAGSQDFELVAWSQGMVRHNFVRTGGTANGDAQPGRAARDVRRRRDDRPGIQPAGRRGGDREGDVRRRRVRSGRRG